MVSELWANRLAGDFVDDAIHLGRIPHITYAAKARSDLASGDHTLRFAIANLCTCFVFKTQPLLRRSRVECASLGHRLQPLTGFGIMRLTDANPRRPPICTASASTSKLARSQRQTSTTFRTNAVQNCRPQAFVRTTWAFHPRKRVLRRRSLVVHVVILPLFNNCIRAEQ